MTILDIKEKENSLITDDAHELICYATISEISSWKDVKRWIRKFEQHL